MNKKKVLKRTNEKKTKRYIVHRILDRRVDENGKVRTANSKYYGHCLNRYFVGFLGRILA